MHAIDCCLGTWIEPATCRMSTKWHSSLASPGHKNTGESIKHVHFVFKIEGLNPTPRSISEVCQLSDFPYHVLVFPNFQKGVQLIVLS